MKSYFGHEKLEIKIYYYSIFCMKGHLRSARHKCRYLHGFMTFIGLQLPFKKNSDSVLGSKRKNMAGKYWKLIQKKQTWPTHPLEIISLFWKLCHKNTKIASILLLLLRLCESYTYFGKSTIALLPATHSNLKWVIAWSRKLAYASNGEIETFFLICLWRFFFLLKGFIPKTLFIRKG